MLNPRSLFSSEGPIGGPIGRPIGGADPGPIGGPRAEGPRADIANYFTLFDTSLNYFTLFDTNLTLFYTI